MPGFRRLASKLRRDPDEMARWVAEDVARIMDAWSARSRLFPLSLEMNYSLDQHHRHLGAAPDSLLR